MYQFNVPDMSCGHCVKAITSAINAVDADSQLEFDLPNHQVSIKSALPEHVLVEVLVESGYPPAPK